jgi:serine/threonine-protein kinase ULK4
MTEVGILHTLSHPNVTRFYCWYETTNHLWVVTEVCVGGDLRTVLAQDGVLGEPAVAAFSRHIAMGLCYCHSQGIVYCDLKPTNVLLAGDGALKLCDFGLAQRAAEVRGPGGARGESRGTPFYMAPELLGQDGVASFASDLYSLGCVMYELATGHPPFLSQSFGQLVTEIMTKPVPMPEGVSPPFWDLLTRLLEKDPLKRITWAELAGHPFWRLCGLQGSTRWCSRRSRRLSGTSPSGPGAASWPRRGARAPSPGSGAGTR